MRFYRRDSRPPQPTPDHKWVAVRSISDFDGNLLEEWGYWYRGEWALAGGGSATTVQTHFRWQEDTSNANAAGSFLFAEDVTASGGISLDTTYVIRFKVENSGDKDETNGSYNLQRLYGGNPTPLITPNGKAAPGRYAQPGEGDTLR